MKWRHSPQPRDLTSFSVRGRFKLLTRRLERVGNYFTSAAPCKLFDIHTQVTEPDNERLKRITSR